MSRGAKFQKRILADFDLGPDEIEVLADAAATMDAIESLSADLSIAALREARQQRALLLRQLAALGLPDSEMDSPTTIQARRAADARWRSKRG